MSTRGVIARPDGDGFKDGRYHHFDSYPSGLGKGLYDLYNGHFQKDIKRMCEVLLDEHPAGWSTIDGDFSLAPGYSNPDGGPNYFSISQEDYEAAMKVYEQTEEYRRPHCYCHGDRTEEENTFTDTDDLGGIEYIYILHEHNHHMVIVDPEYNYVKRATRFSMLADIDLNGPEPDWGHLKEGEEATLQELLQDEKEQH